MISDKLAGLLALSFEDMTRLADAAVGYPKRVKIVLAKNAPEIAWLYGRDETGLFPDAALI